MCVPSGVECVSQLGKRDQTPDPSLELAHSHSLVRRWRRNHVLRKRARVPVGCRRELHLRGSRRAWCGFGCRSEGVCKRQQSRAACGGAVCSPRPGRSVSAAQL